jgi:hypothetical protein
MTSDVSTKNKLTSLFPSLSLSLSLPFLPYISFSLLYVFNYLLSYLELRRRL